MIAYLRGDAAKGSVTAHLLGAGKTGLSAGYHLIQLSPATDADEAAINECKIRRVRDRGRTLQQGAWHQLRAV